MHWSWGKESSFSMGRSTLFLHQNEWSLKKETIILLHGFPDGPIVWENIAKQLDEHFNIIVPYLPGVHEKCSLYKKMSETFQLNLLLLLKSDKRLSGTIHLVGHDVGGVLVDQLSHLLGESCASITFISTMGLNLYSKNLKLDQMIKSWYVPIFSTKIGQSLMGKSNLLGKKLLQKMDPTVIEAHIPEKLGSIKLYREFVEILYQRTRWDRINNKKALFLFSTEDPFVQIPTQKAVREYYPDSEIRVQSGGHWEFCQRPEKFSELIIKFIEKLEINLGENNGFVEV